ncbi:MAG: primosomal protein N', partial [Oscillospiraceae bacterium]|nr:primosomal protein N' [Oscillospiraceae bacterium]
HARDVARFRGGFHGCLTVLASATPSVESYYHAKAGNYLLVELSKRYGGAVLPDVELVDMTQERQAGVSGEVSQPLAEEVRLTLARGEQAILLLNRRGYHTRALCQSCKDAVTCPNCSIALTYHSANGRLMCHYCGYSRSIEEGCPQCGGKVERFQGVGTQKLEEEVRELFPTARVLRMDADTTMAKYAHEEKFRDFAEGRYDLMVGTQMVAKGLNFPGVTLVGVLAPDATLFGDDFKSEERTFSLITQVIGRAGRGKKHGKAIIQTFVPENRVMIESSEQDYETFYQNEIICRKVMLYPPFCSMCAIGFSGERESEVIRAARGFLDALTSRARRDYPDIPLRVLGCTPNLVVKVSGKYRYKIVIKCKNSPRFREMIGALLAEFGRDPASRGVSAYGDMYFDGSM